MAIANDVYNHYHKYIKSDLTYVPSARPGSRRDRSISTPSRRKTNDRRFSLRAPCIACCTDRIRHVSRSREISALGEWHARLPVLTMYKPFHSYL